MKKLLVISLYDGNNEIDEVDEEEYSHNTSSATRCTQGDRVIWMLSLISISETTRQAETS